MKVIRQQKTKFNLFHRLLKKRSLKVQMSNLYQKLVLKKIVPNIINDEQNIAGGSNTLSRSSYSQPDGDCLFDPSLPKCAPDENGNCPEGFNMNEDGQCFPQHDGCPGGYHSVDDDETGRCIPSDSEGCPSGMIFRPDMKTCGYKERCVQDNS